MQYSYPKSGGTMIFGALMALAIGLLVSPTVLALFHILMIVPMITFLTKADYSKFPKSAWALLALGVVLILSVFVNQDIAVKGFAPLSKTKYFILAFLMIAPLGWYFKNRITDKKMTILLYTFLGAATFATLIGIYARSSGYNPISMREVNTVRNAGLFGMVMNYAHNLSFFLIIVSGLVIYRRQITKYINSYFLYTVLIINLIGLYLTYTRGAWLGYLAAMPFFLFKKNKKYFLAFILSFFILSGVLYKVAGIHVIRPQSDMQRLSQWQAATKAFMERPILGFGYLNFEQHSFEIKKRYDLPEKDFGGHAHSNLFEMLGSAGALGLIAFILWIFFWFKEMHDRHDVVAKITLPFIIVFFVGGLTQSTISLGINLFYVMGAYCISTYSQEKT